MSEKIGQLRDFVRSCAGRAGRSTLLAYALLRGRPYRDVELTTRRGNAPSTFYVAKEAEVPVEVVAAWLAIPADPVRIARVETLRDVYLAARRARGAEIRLQMAAIRAVSA